MNVLAYEIPPEIEMDILDYMRHYTFTRNAIARKFEILLDKEVAFDRTEVCDCAAGRLIQRERRAGNIAKKSRYPRVEWKWIGSAA